MDLTHLHRSQGFEFCHLLTRDAAYDALLASNRRALHSAAADSLAARLISGTPDELNRLARVQEHLELAERWEEAHQRCCARLRRRAGLGRLDDWPALAERAEELWRRARDQDQALPEWSAGFANAKALYLGLISQTDEATVWANRALSLARSAGDVAEEGLALNHCGLARHYSGQREEAIEFYKQSLERFTTAGHAMGQMQAMNNVGLALQESGNTTESRQWLERGLALARESDHPLLEANLALNLGIGFSNTAEAERGRPFLERALELALQFSDISTESFALGYLGNLEVARGNFAAAHRMLATTCDLASRMKQPRLIVWWTGEQADALRAEGRYEEANEIAAQALTLARHCGDSYVLAHATFRRAELAIELADARLGSELLAEFEQLVGGEKLEELDAYYQRYTEARRKLDLLSQRAPA